MFNDEFWRIWSQERQKELLGEARRERLYRAIGREHRAARSNLQPPLAWRLGELVIAFGRRLQQGSAQSVDQAVR